MTTYGFRMPVYTRAFASTHMRVYTRTCTHTKKWERVTWLLSLCSGITLATWDIVFTGENFIFIGMELKVFIQKKKKKTKEDGHNYLQICKEFSYEKRGVANEGRSAERKLHSSSCPSLLSTCSKGDLFFWKTGRIQTSPIPTVLMQELATNCRGDSAIH